MSNMDAWAAAVQRVSSRASLRQSYPVDALHKALQDYFVFTASSSGVEQSFTKAQWAFTDRQGSALAETELTILKLVLDSNRDEDRSTCKVARKIFGRLFGMERERKQPRIDQGCPRAKPSNTSSTEAAFLRCRRQKLPQATAPAQTADHDYDIGQAWNENHDGEAAFAARKLEKRRRQAMRENLLLPSERSAELEQATQVEIAKQTTDARTRERDLKRRKERSSGAKFSVEWLRGKTVLVDPNCGQDMAAVQHAARGHGLRLVDRLGLARVIVQASLVSPARLHKCFAILSGCFVVVPATLTSPSPHACCMKYKAAMGKPRKIYVSDEFRQQNEPIWRLISATHRSLRCHSKWVFLDRAAYLRARQQNRKSKTIVALVTTREKREDQDL